VAGAGVVASSDAYELIEITVDSGAEESVLPSASLTQFPAVQTQQSIGGEQFVAANGGILSNEGERTVSIYTHDMVKRDMTFQVTGVNKALASVSRICDRGHRVVFDQGGSFIQNKKTGDTIPLQRKHGVWVLEVWAEKRTIMAQSHNAHSGAGFHWQG
jgi:hypothetical protein